MNLKDRLDKLATYREQGKSIKYWVEYCPLFQPGSNNEKAKYIVSCVIRTRKNIHYFIGDFVYDDLKQCQDKVNLLTENGSNKKSYHTLFHHWQHVKVLNDDKPD